MTLTKKIACDLKRKFGVQEKGETFGNQPALWFLIVCREFEALNEDEFIGVGIYFYDQRLTRVHFGVGDDLPLPGLPTGRIVSSTGTRI